jgi:hypothetical protein
LSKNQIKFAGPQIKSRADGMKPSERIIALTFNLLSNAGRAAPFLLPD